MTMIDNRSTGSVKLTSHVTVGQRIIKSGFLDRFHSSHRGITVESIMDQRALDISNGEADIAIRGGNFGDDNDRSRIAKIGMNNLIGGELAARGRGVRVTRPNSEYRSGSFHQAAVASGPARSADRRGGLSSARPPRRTR